MSAKLGGKTKKQYGKKRLFASLLPCFQKKRHPSRSARRIFYSFMPNFADV